MTIFLDALGIGLIIPSMPDIIRRFNSDPEFVNQYFGYFISVYALMQFVASPVLGSLSDKFGRRPILLMSLLGAGLDYILMAFAPNLAILFIGRIISGLTGASMTVASAYMADVSDDSNRSANFGLIGAGWGFGFIAGPVIGGFLGGYDHAAPFLGAAVLNLLNFAFGVFILPESLPKEMRRNISLSRLNPMKSIVKALRPSPILVLIWVYILLFMAGQVHPSIWTLYTQYRFQWTAFEVGLSLSFVGVSIAIAQGYLTRIVIPKLGEEKSLVMAIFVNILGFALFGLATQGWMMYAIMAATAIAGVGGPALQSLLAKHVPPSEQGELQGTLMSLASVTAILGPLLYTNLFSYYTERGHIVPGAPYICAAGFCLVCLVMVKVFEKKEA